jgi:WD40 repeat protein
MGQARGVIVLVFCTLLSSFALAQTKLKTTALLKHREDLIFQGANFSPDGSRLISVDNTGTLYLWDVNKTYPLSFKSLHKGGAQACAYSKDGRYIITGGQDKTIVVTKVIGLSPLKTITGLPSPVKEVAMAGNRLVALLMNNEIRIYNTDTWEFISKPKYAARESRILFNNKGDRFFVWFASRIYEVAAKDGELINMFNTNYATPTDLAISADDKLLAVGFSQAEEIVRIYSLPDMKQVKSIGRNGAGDKASGMAFFNHSNKLLYQSSAGVANFKVLDLDTDTNTSVSKGDAAARAFISRDDKNVVLAPKFSKAIQLMSFL